MFNWIFESLSPLTAGSVTLATVIGLLVFFFKKPIEDWWRPYGDWIVRSLLGRIPQPPPIKTEAANETKESASPATNPPNEESAIDLYLKNLTPPDYRREYKEDIIKKIKWRWDWTEAAKATPETKCIENLQSYCPRCGREVEQRTHYGEIDTDVRMGTMPGTQQRYRNIAAVAHRPLYECVAKHFKEILDLDPSEVDGFIKREIVYRANHPEERQATL